MDGTAALTKKSLSDLDYDALFIVFSFIDQYKDKSNDDQIFQTSFNEPLSHDDTARPALSAIRSLSMTSKYFRNVTAPWTFRYLSINACDWATASLVLKAIEKHPGMLENAR
jgi:hypothetical protein